MKRSKRFQAATLLAILAASAVLLAVLLATGTPPVFAQCIVPPNGAVVKTTDYAALAGDTGKLIVMNCASACTLTLPATPQTPVWQIWVASIGAAAATISPNGRNLDGSASSLTLSGGLASSVMIMTDNMDYFSARGNSTASGGYTVLPNGGTTAITASAASWLSPGLNGSTSSVIMGTVMTASGTASNLYAKTDAAPGGSLNFVITVENNTSAQTLTCTITGAATTCNDTTHTFTYAAGDRLRVKVLTDATSPSVRVSASFRMSN